MRLCVLNVAIGLGNLWVWSMVMGSWVGGTELGYFVSFLQ